MMLPVSARSGWQTHSVLESDFTTHPKTKRVRDSTKASIRCRGRGWGKNIQRLCKTGRQNRNMRCKKLQASSFMVHLARLLHHDKGLTAADKCDTAIICYIQLTHIVMIIPELATRTLRSNINALPSTRRQIPAMMEPCNMLCCFFLAPWPHAAPPPAFTQLLQCSL